MSDSTTETIIVVGASSFIAQAFINQAISEKEHDLPLTIISVSRQSSLIPPAMTRPTLADNMTQNVTHHHVSCDYQQASISTCIAEMSSMVGTITKIIICNGILHSKTTNETTDNENTGTTHLMPEKRIEDINSDALQQLFYANSIVPMLWLSALTELLLQQPHKIDNPKCVISILSARVGSISDNRLGGWYGYRASKAALNMLIKTTAVEYARRLKRVKLIAFHPGTTDTPLSKPFQANVPAGKLFTPEFVASQLYNIMVNIEPNGEASYLDWQGKEISW
ncbi:SDR family NAD(P)-dependent oxidoreductase [Shewanella polaris]|uniref:SDR family NAD(P)-dependent oxidoreductase n=1 Tax=Shewanella polaris TaxID=2588449 RepID=A0A4Y5YC01_9GAMM|nr:SDR family NAD(P)-dependent oxidoreductase [Shewanella polaris]QDE30119.1 SDR family NAD(P)-dependent oxidoreductase [Shewanella polaris]